MLTLFAFFNKSPQFCQENVYRDVWFSWDSWPFSVTYTHLTLKGSFHPLLKIPTCEEIPYYVTYQSSAYRSINILWLQSVRPGTGEMYCELILPQNYDLMNDDAVHRICTVSLFRISFSIPMVTVWLRVLRCYEY